jgi:MFS family permease
MGMLPEHALHTSGTPRTHWLLATFAALSAALLAAAAAAHPSHLYLLSLALGLCYGGIFSLIPAIAADVFGLRHFAATYSGLQTACAIGCYVFPTQLAGGPPMPGSGSSNSWCVTG